MRLYAVSLHDFGQHWIEFYWADDSDHAEEQAVDANPHASIFAVAVVPIPEEIRERSGE